MNKISKIMLVAIVASCTALTSVADSLKSVVSGDHRTEKNVIRDVYRNPQETLAFFGINEEMTVIENWPGGGWYTEILAAYLKDKGHYIAATYNRNPDTQKSWQARLNKEFDETFTANKKTYGELKVVSFSPGIDKELAMPGTVDAILDFRNAHNWIRSAAVEVPSTWYKALKKGGIVGIVDHRMDDNKPYIPANGYVHEAQVIEIMEKQGFKFVDKSDINSNPRDTKDHPKGVWTLPPTLAEKDANRNKYLAIGESDRMVLKFVKP